MKAELRLSNPMAVRAACALALLGATLSCAAQAQGPANAAQAPSAQARAQMAPDELVKTVTLEVLDIIIKDKEIQAGDRRKVVALVEEKVLPHFNFTRMTALAVGANWRSATPEQKKQLIEEFRTLLVRTYASSLTAYRDQRFDFRPLRAKPTDTDVTVVVRILQPGAQPVQLEYDMEKTAAGWKAWDVRVAGISLVINYRTEFANLVRQSGIDGLIKTIAAKNNALESANGAAKK
jgi:phospholipid transport system substrate-binding protein